MSKRPTYRIKEVFGLYYIQRLHFKFFWVSIKRINSHVGGHDYSEIIYYRDKESAQDMIDLWTNTNISINHPHGVW